MITTRTRTDPDRKQTLAEDKYNATNFLTLWDFEGVLKYTPIFYGWYSNKETFKTGYRLPLAYFITELAVYVYSFVATLRKMAENSRMSKLSEKDDECIFTWKLFTGWDYMIGNPETAQNRVMSVITGFKEALLEEAEKKRKDRNWKIIWTRVFVNLTVLALFALSAAAVVVVVGRSTEPEANSTVWRKNETTVVMTLLSFIFPMILEFLGFWEQYHPRKQLRIQLARIMLLNLLNLYSLIFAQFNKINGMTKELHKFKPNVTSTTADPLTSEVHLTSFAISTFRSTEDVNLTNCRTVCYNMTQMEDFTIDDLITTVATTVATTAFPKFWNTLSTTLSTQNMSFTDYGFTTDSYFNYTFLGNISAPNATDFTFTTLNASDLIDGAEIIVDNFRDRFEDYLTYLLETMELWNGNFTNSQNFSNVFVNSTEFFNNTSSNFTTIWQDPTTYEYFKTTLAPILNFTSQNIDERFETEITKFYDEISSTIKDIQESIILTPFWQKCEQQCETAAPTLPYSATFSSTTSTSTLDPLDISHDSYEERTKLRSLCWETMFGQELVKLTVMDFVFTVGCIIGIDFVRGVFVRVMNKCFCWDLEKKFPEYGEFKVAENILHLVNNQGMVWMGMFFAPGVVLINIVKLVLLMYLRSWAVLTCNVPHAIIFRASRSNNFYFALLLIMLFLCVLPVGYAIVWVEPSWHCGPFSKYPRIYYILTKTIRVLVPKELHIVLDYVVSPGIVIPLLVLLILIIYYLISLTNSLREANADLKIQLRQERTEERRKMFQIADRRRRAGSGGSGELDNTPFAKWKKLLGNLPTGKSMDDNSKGPVPTIAPNTEPAKIEVNKTRDLVSKFIRRALRKPSVTSEEESGQMQDDATDTEQPESLPEDIASFKESKPQIKLPGKTFVISNSKNKPEVLQRGSTDSTEGKHVQIADINTDIQRKQSFPRRDTFDIKKREEWRQKKRNQSPSRSSSSKDTRHDSIASNWSDNIPVITISKTESSECILEQNLENSGNSEPKSEKGDTTTNTTEDKETIKTAEQVKVSSSTDTLVADEEEELNKPKIVKHILKKQTEAIEKDEVLASDGISRGSGEKDEVLASDGISRGSGEKDGRSVQSEEESTKTTIKSKNLEKSSTSGTSDTTKTESSADYKDKSLS